jgi:hypothetical protein
MKQIQKQPKMDRKTHTILKISSKKKSAVLRLLPNVCDFQKENHILGYGFKNLYKIFSIANGFFFLCDFHLWACDFVRWMDGIWPT